MKRPDCETEDETQNCRRGKAELESAGPNSSAKSRLNDPSPLDFFSKVILCNKRIKLRVFEDEEIVGKLSSLRSTHPIFVFVLF